MPSTWGCWGEGRREVDDLIRLDEFAEFYYRGDPTPSQMESLRIAARDGWLARFAVKIGKRWFVRKEVLNGTK